MKAVYDAKTDILGVVLTNAPMQESNEDTSGIMLDYDADGNIVGLEVLSASTQVKDPRSPEHLVR